jgi:hypothetical protein
LDETAYRIDRNTLRTNQAFIVGLTVLAFVIGDGAGRWLILGTTLVMGLGTAHPAFELFKHFHRHLLKPAGVLGPKVVPEDPMPHQFAQAVGAVFLMASTIALFSGATTAGWVLSWIVTVLAFINLTVSFCAGCFVSYQLDRIGMLPRSIASSRAAE